MAGVWSCQPGALGRNATDAGSLRNFMLRFLVRCMKANAAWPGLARGKAIVTRGQHILAPEFRVVVPLAIGPVVRCRIPDRLQPFSVSFRIARRGDVRPRRDVLHGKAVHEPRASLFERR